MLSLTLSGQQQRGRQHELNDKAVFHEHVDKISICIKTQKDTTKGGLKK